MKVDGKEETEIFKEDHCVHSALNVTDNWIYYMKDIPSKNGKSIIYKVKLDGSEKTEILNKDTYIFDIVVVEDWIYYRISGVCGAYDEYKIKTDGSGYGKV